MNILFCQFSNNLINNSRLDTKESNYYNKIYNVKNNDGYVRPDHFFEIPMWIAELNYIINGDLYIIENIHDAINHINNSKYTHILFSGLDVTKSYIKTIVKNTNKHIVIGRDLNYNFKRTKKVDIFNSVIDFCNNFGLEYKKGTDYSLFKGYETIPRLQLSIGCKHHCKFCTVDNIVKSNNYDEIIQQVKSFKDLNFKLIYLDDKTFGQSKNYRILKKLNIIIKKFNPKFNGFIIQTTSVQISKIDFSNLNIFAAEIGVESFNDEILKSLNKPSSEKLINNAINILEKSNINFIPNIMIGLPGEDEFTYYQTIIFLKANNFYFVNVYNLALYEESELGKELDLNEDDKNELVTEKSIYSNDQNKLNKLFSDELFDLLISKL